SGRSSQSAWSYKAPGRVTIKMLDYLGGNPGLSKGVDTLIGEFQTANPDVTIQREQSSYDDLLTKQQLIMTSDDPPDINDIALNFTAIGKLVQSGLILSLDKYDKQYGWSSKFSPFLYGLG